MHQMDRDEWLAFVMHGTRTGKLATVRANGAPHVVPIWFVIDTSDGVDRIVFTTGANTVKAKALRRDPRFALCVDDDNPPYSYVQFQAEAELSEDLDEMLPLATRLGARYMGEDAAEAFGRRNAVPGEVLVRGTIARVVAEAGIAH
jgi:PPOX class probable F420-dependent enzyme